MFIMMKQLICSHMLSILVKRLKAERKICLTRVNNYKVYYNIDVNKSSVNSYSFLQGIAAFADSCLGIIRFE